MNPTFTEIQKFNKWWMYILFALPFLLTGIPYLLVQLNFIEPKNEDKSSSEIIFLIIFSLIIFIWGITIYLKKSARRQSRSR